MRLLTNIFDPLQMNRQRKLKNDSSINDNKNGELSLTDHFVCLSDREKELTALAAEGLTSDQIAHKLHISTATVQKHRNNILCKLNAANMVEVGAKAIRNGWIQ